MVHFVGDDSAAVQSRLAFVVIARHDLVSYCFWYAPGSGTPGVRPPPWHIWYLLGASGGWGGYRPTHYGLLEECRCPGETLWFYCRNLPLPLVELVLGNRECADIKQTLSNHNLK